MRLRLWRRKSTIGGLFCERRGWIERRWIRRDDRVWAVGYPECRSLSVGVGVRMRALLGASAIQPHQV